MSSVALRNRQFGLSLIELMVAMIIGVFLILGVTQIFINNQRTYLFQQGQIGNQENGRFTLALLSQELLKAGYRSNLGADIPADNSLSGCPFPAGAAVVALSATSLCIQYQADNKVDTGCLGTALSGSNQNNIVKPYVAVTLETTARPKIVEMITFDSTTSTITCTTASATQQLVSGVKDLRFEYGAGVADSKAVTSYSTAPTGVIAAVRYSALMQSPGTATIRDTTVTTPLALTDWNSRYATTYGTSASDKTSIYQIVQGTVMVRNQMQ